MPKGETVVDPRTGEEFEVVWDAAAERRGETFHLTQPLASRAHAETQPRDPQQRPLRHGARDARCDLLLLPLL